MGLRFGLLHWLGLFLALFHFSRILASLLLARLLGCFLRSRLIEQAIEALYLVLIGRLSTVDLLHKANHGLIAVNIEVVEVLDIPRVEDMRALHISWLV